VRISGSNAGYSMFRGSVKCTGHTLHSPVSPSLPLPYVTVCRHISTGVYGKKLINYSELEFNNSQASTSLRIQVKDKGKGKFHPRTGHEGPQEE